MRSNTSKASVLGLGVALALVLGMSAAGALDDRDIVSRKTVVETATPVSQMDPPLCAWRHCQITP